MENQVATTLRRIFGFLFVLAVLLVALPPLQAAEYFIAPDGNDTNLGTDIEKPFRTLQRAADAAVAGDSCFIRAGVYRETVSITKSGEQERPITFSSYQGERVIIDGSDIVTGAWNQSGDKIWKVKVAAKESIESVFIDERMLVEARWPNCSWEENWQPEKKWALTGKGTALGQIESAALAESGQDFRNGVAYIKLSKGNNCFTRPVTAHHPGSATLLYDSTGVEGRAWGEDSMPERIKSYGFEDNRFFLAARGALDVPGEWWHDVEQGELLLIPPDGLEPSQSAVSIKARVAGFEGNGVSNIVINTLEFHKCNVRFAQSSRIVLQGCRFLFPSTPKVFPGLKTAEKMEQNLRIEGADTLVERCLIEWAVDGAIEIEGSGNRVENCVVHDCNLHGRHPGPGISVDGAESLSNRKAQRSADAIGSAEAGSHVLAPNVIRRCTVYNIGSVGIYARGAAPATLDHNHIFNAGLYCVDVSSLYVPIGRKMRGTAVHHNWLHDIRGIGYRVDIEGREMVFHHNLVWNASVGCKMQGFQLEGYNNTLIVNNPKGGIIVVFEPGIAPAERAGWRVRNNVAYSFLDRMSWRSDYKNADREFVLPLKPETGAIDSNATIVPGAEDQFFVNANQYDFRPKPGGPLDASGLTVPGIAEGDGERPPSIGALETEGEPWLAGADWLNEDLPVPRSAKAATELARRLRPENCVIETLDSGNKEE
ncbi:MAG: right-handed parallel beta-helix repeat-containing protein [Candidatus Hydrogenedentales bacterium]